MTALRLWRPVQAGGRAPFVVCIVCRARELNEHIRLRRGGWQDDRRAARVPLWPLFGGELMGKRPSPNTQCRYCGEFFRGKRCPRCQPKGGRQ